MKSSAKKVELASVDDLFSTEESRADAQREKVMDIPLSDLHAFKGHPFKVVDDEAMMAALERGKVARYVTDFPNNTINLAPNVVPIPHLGASTPESEDNCAIMAAQQLRDFLENGNIKNSVNFPNVEMERSGVQRLCIIHRNIPAMLANITAQLSGDGVNVENMTNKSRGDFAYTLVDVGSAVEESVIDDIRAIDGIIRVRVIS